LDVLFEQSDFEDRKIGSNASRGFRNATRKGYFVKVEVTVFKNLINY